MFSIIKKRYDMHSAISEGNIEKIKKAFDAGCTSTRYDMMVVAGSHTPSVIHFLREYTRCPWDESACSYAALNKKLENLKFLHESGCPWDENTTSSASAAGCIDCLMYAHQNVCPWNSETSSLTVIYNVKKHITTLIKSLKTPDWMNEHYVEPIWSQEDIDNIINECETHNQNLLICLSYLHKNGCPWDENTICEAIFNDNIKCLKYAYENSCPMPTKQQLLKLITSCDADVQETHIENESLAFIKEKLNF